MEARDEGIYKVRIRYSETDQMGFVYYGNYARFYEIGRTELMRSIGIHYKSMEEEGIMMPVVSMEVKYLRPAKYDEWIEIRTRIKKLTNSAIVFVSFIYNNNGELLNRGIVKLCFLDKKTRKRIPCPVLITNKVAENQ